VTADLARRITDAAVAATEQVGVPSCVAVVDEPGVLKPLFRLGGAALIGEQ
jgi:uncharacterized protein GlcG (DUF336 family)